MNYNTISLKNIYNMVGKDVTEEVLIDFKCNLNQEIENFLKNKAIEFSKKSIAETFIVTAKYKDKDLMSKKNYQKQDGKILKKVLTSG